MPQTIKSESVQLIDMSKIFSSEEIIVGMISEVGLPILILTNKAIYRWMFGKGIVVETGEKYNTYQQITKEFDFSPDHPLFQNTYGIAQKTNNTLLKIFAYDIMSKLSSLLKITEFLFFQWNIIENEVNKDIKNYETTPKTLPLIPLLKENVDAYFVECKNIISDILTMFKIYFQRKTINSRNIGTLKCLNIIKKENNPPETIKLFQTLNEIDTKVRAIRNAISHPENYKENIFFLYNVYWGNHNVLSQPFFEYQSTIEKKLQRGQEELIPYFKKTYESLLDISGSFMKETIKHI